MLRKILSAVFIFVAAVGVLGFYASRTLKTVVIERTFDAPVEKVWALWTDPATMKKWWGPHGYFAPTLESDLRVEGKFLLGMKTEGEGGTIVYNAGTYTEVIPQQKIAAVMSFADASGNPVPAETYGVPGKWPAQQTVVFEFSAPAEGKTHVKITEEGIPMIMSVFAKMGWEQQFEKMDALLKN